MIKKISIIGCGSFGYALGIFLSRFHNKTSVYFYDVQHNIVKSLQDKRKHPFFHKSHFAGKNVSATISKEECLSDSELVIMAVPAQLLRNAVAMISNLIPKKAIILNVSKALERKTNKRMSEVIKESLKKSLKRRASNPIATLSGGMLAHDLVSGNPVSADIGCENKKARLVLKDLFKPTSMEINLTKDIVGVELGGAFKNVISIGAGIVDGLKLGYSTKAFFISHSTNELKSLAKKLGAKEVSTLTNSWEVDIMTSCFGDSRNRLFGELIGKGRSKYQAEDFLKRKKKHAEGLATLKVVKKLLDKHKVKALFIQNLYKIVYLGKNSRNLF